MKKIKIRFIEVLDVEGKTKHYNIQIKKYFIWFTQYEISSVEGKSGRSPIISYDKESLLELILDVKIKNCKEYIIFIEYPALKIY
jgi:hypothetical protein